MEISIRTCIVCRKKYLQKELNRLQCKEKKLITFSGIGRSFYICNDCLKDDKRVEKSLYRNCKNKDNYIVQLREILKYGRQS